MLTRKATVALDAGKNGLELIDSSALAATFDNLAQLALDGDGVLEMVLLQLDRSY